ncbi:MAG: DUF2357 domain-containing protein [Pyrinomonadaceae bacterium]
MSTDRAGSLPSSETLDDEPSVGALRFLDQEGREVDTPREWEPALVEVLIAPARWEQARLLLQGGELPLYLQRLRDELSVLADWPRSGAGHYRLQLLRDVESAAENYVVTVRPRKLSDEQFDQLLADLETLPGAVALSLQRMGALSGVKLLPPSETTLAAEVSRLRRAVSGSAGRPGLLTVLTRMAADPHRVLRHIHERVPRERARRPSPTHLAAAVMLRHNVGQDGLPMRVVDARVEHTVDVYENRLVKTFYGQVRARLRRLLPALLAAKQDAAWSEMQGLEENLRRARRQAIFLDDVGQLSHLPLRLTMVLLKRPLYRAAFEGFIELHRSAWAVLDSPALDSPLENLPTLYQHWGTLRVFHAALEVAADLGYEIERQTLLVRESGGVFVRILPDGLTVIMLEHPRHGTRAELVVERSYAKTGGLRSISYSQRPDVTLEVHPRTGAPRLYLFDPKYKLMAENADAERSDGKPKKEDLDKMHAYRDAIRDASGERVIEYAAIMYPGSETETYGQGLEALSSLPGSVGVLETRLRKLLFEALVK